MQESRYQHLDTGHENIEEEEDQDDSRLAELVQHALSINRTDQARQEGMWVPVQHTVCPLSRQVWRDPYMTPSGNSYERVLIEDVILQTGTSPLTRQRLQRSDLRPNNVLKRIISQAFVTKKRCRTEDTPLTPPRKMRELSRISTEIKGPDPHGACGSSGALSRTTHTVYLLHASPLVYRQVAPWPIGYIDRACPPLNLRAELESFHAVSALKYQPCVANVRNLRDVLATHCDSKIIQISAHCSGKGFFFENLDGSAHNVEMETFAAAGPWGTVSLLMLLTCHSVAQLDRLREIWKLTKSSEPEHVVYCKTVVSDAAARLYSSEFYYALGAANEISHCHRLAQKALRSSNKPGMQDEADCFELVDIGANAHRRTPEILSQSFVALQCGQQQPAHEDYLGRNRFLCEIGRMFQQRRMLALLGCRGMGKTASLNAAVQYFSALHGRFFAAGAFLIDIARTHAAHSNAGWPANRVLEEALIATIRKRIFEPPAEYRGCMHDLDCLMQIMDHRGPWLVALDNFSDQYFDQEQFQSMNSFLADLVRTSHNLHVILAMHNLPPKSWVCQYAEAGVKLVDAKLPPLDVVDAARLFLRRSRRPLYLGDFQKHGEDSPDDHRKMLPEGIAGDEQGALDRLMNSAILDLTGRVPGEIIAAAAEVTEDLLTLAEHPRLAQK